jgi:SAM-dependent methyltransferase
MTAATAAPPHREPERLDDAHLPYVLAERALRGLARVNRALFGHGALRRTLLPRLLTGPPGGRRQRLLDLGTGTGEGPARLAHRAAGGGVDLAVVGVDRKLTHLAVGRRHGHRQARVVAAADALPFRAGAFDWAVSSLFFHHFDAADNRRVAGEMRRVARTVAIVDLRRHPLARLLARALIPLLGVCPITRHDGVVSADRAWPLAAVRRFAAGLGAEELRRRFPFRFSLVVRGEDGGG